MKHPSRHSSATRHTARGFTLVELMITVVIIGVLATLAYPSFTNSIRKARREDGHNLLLAAQIAQEKHRVSNADYSSATTALTGACPSSGNCDSQERYYRLAISGTSATAYTLTANAQGSQASDTGCTSLVLTYSNGTSSRTPAGCWNK